MIDTNIINNNRNDPFDDWIKILDKWKRDTADWEAFLAMEAAEDEEAKEYEIKEAQNKGLVTNIGILSLEELKNFDISTIEEVDFPNIEDLD